MKRPTALVAVMVKEVRQTLRDRRVLFVLVVGPIIQLVVLGYAVNLDISRIPTVIADEDRTAESRAFADGLVAGDTFERVATVPGGDQAFETLVRGKASIGLVIPRGFGRARAANEPVAVQVFADGADPLRATLGQNAVEAYVQQAAMRAAMVRPAVIIEPRIYYNPNLESALYFVPGVAATLLLIVALIVMAMGLAREREMGTLEQILVTPIRPFTLIAGKTLPLAVIGLIDLALVMVVAIVLFGVPVRGPLGVVFLGGALYLLSVLGLGLFLSSVARTQQQAFFLAMIIALPAILLSGFMTPVANMPEILQPVTVINPVRHFVEILRAVMLEGAGVGDVLPQLAALAGIGVVIFVAATLLVRRSLA